MKRRYSLPILSALSLFVLVASTWVVLKLIFPTAPPDPFETYTPIMPGQSSARLVQFSCASTMIDDHLPQGWSYCQIHPKNGPIQCVTVIIKGQRIISVVFDITGLQFGHVAQRWGHPDILKPIRGFYTAYWTEGVYATAPTSGWFTYQSDVRIVSLRDVDPLETNF